MITIYSVLQIKSYYFLIRSAPAMPYSDGVRRLDIHFSY